MKKDLKDPLFNKTYKVEAAVVVPEAVTAAHSLANTDMCPSCRLAMKQTLAAGIPCMSCVSCRICLPKKDS